MLFLKCIMKVEFLCVCCIIGIVCGGLDLSSVWLVVVFCLVGYSVIGGLSGLNDWNYKV